MDRARRVARMCLPARGPSAAVLVLPVLLALAGCGAGGGETAAEAGTKTAHAAAGRTAPPASDSAMTVRLSVLSSPAQYVSGGDARVHLRAAPGLRDKLELWLKGSAVAADLKAVANGLEGVVTGLVEGPNTLQVRHRSAGVRDSLELVTHAITGPMFSGPQQVPFVCTATQFGLQPRADATTQPGYVVCNAQGAVTGYSRNCSIDTVVSYLYRGTSGGFKPLPAGGVRPADMATTTLADGRTVDFIVRREVGSINRFLYSFAMLAPAGEAAGQADLGLWNRKLVYWFQGGVAIGHSQGTADRSTPSCWARATPSPTAAATTPARTTT